MDINIRDELLARLNKVRGKIRDWDNRKMNIQKECKTLLELRIVH